MDTRWTGGHRSARYCRRAPSPEMKAHPGVGCSSAALATDCPGKGLVDTDQLTTAPGPPSPEMTVMGPGVQEAGGALGGGPGADPLSLRPGRRWRPTSEQGGGSRGHFQAVLEGRRGRGLGVVAAWWGRPGEAPPSSGLSPSLGPVGFRAKAGQAQGCRWVHGALWGLFGQTGLAGC